MKLNTNRQTVDLISKFYRIVNKGPVYVCCCCDRLWCKHSVSSAAKLREKPLDVDKYLLNKRRLELLASAGDSFISRNLTP